MTEKELQEYFDKLEKEEKEENLFLINLCLVAFGFAFGSIILICILIK